VRTLFNAYYLARKLENISDKFISVYASSNIEVYPFQIAAADFALNSPYKRGAILCDESGMGKSHEAMLAAVQKWYEGKRAIIFVPNFDFIYQWVEIIDKYYTVPYIVIANKEQWNNNRNQNGNAFEQEGIVLTTYGFASGYYKYAKKIQWDLAIFEEATALSTVYKEESKQAKILKDITENSFKLLLTGTPIEKNIMDLYGLIYFIDEEILPDEQSFLKRYLRKPENYPELSKIAGRYCFRTLKEQVKQYAKITNRIFITYEYELSEKERKLYDMIYNYCNKDNKIAFPEISNYDLTLKLLDIQGSSTAAILRTIKEIIKRIENIKNAEEETEELKKIKATAEEIETDVKTKHLISVLKNGFQLLKKLKAPKKAVIFTSSIVTQKYLYNYLKDKYKTVIYNGMIGYSAIDEFKNEAELLISSDYGARGFNLEEAAFIIHYDLLYNTLKMEQRIDRCHRIGQNNDVISAAFIDINNFADVRKLELVNKRTLVTDGVFGITNKVIGGFTKNIKETFDEISKTIRTSKQIEAEYQNVIQENKEENKKAVSNAENILFTTFTKKIADKITITPQYVEERSKELNETLWELVKCFFEQYNKSNNDCFYVIDEANRTITASNYKELPCLFYYSTKNGNKKYISHKKYGMSPDFKPHTGRITLSSVIGRGIIENIECYDTGTIIVNKDIEPCVIALYSLKICKDKAEYNYYILLGKTQSGRLLSEIECSDILNMSLEEYSDENKSSSHWLKISSSSSERYNKYRELDKLIDINRIYKSRKNELTEAQLEEADRIKLIVQNKKSMLAHEIRDLQKKIEEIEETAENCKDRVTIFRLKKELIDLKDMFMRKQENLFFKELELDAEAENEINKLFDDKDIKSELYREFVVNVKGKAE